VSADPDRPAAVDIDLAAVEANVRWLRSLAPASAFWAVVKANAYGHGAVPVAQAALAAGADALAVALVSEGEELRAAGIEAPIIVLSEPPIRHFGRAAAARLQITVASFEGIAAAAGVPLRLHLKIDTGMHRIGVSPARAVEAVAALVGAGGELGSLWTHCAVADDPSNPFTDRQLDRFDAAVGAIAAAGLPSVPTHVANSAATINVPRARRDIVRCGIAIYGLAPSPALRDHTSALRPSLRLTASISQVRRVGAGEGVSYGLRYRPTRSTTIATVPIGYGDGVPRRLFDVGGEVLVAGQRCPLAGVVTMDQLMVDVGDLLVRPGDPVVLLGADGAATVTVDEWAERLGTITYEITCALGARLARRYR
jgi:alanine racemase